MPLTPAERDKFRRLDDLLTRRRPMAGGPCVPPRRLSAASWVLIGGAVILALVMLLQLLRA